MKNFKKYKILMIISVIVFVVCFTLICISANRITAYQIEKLGEVSSKIHYYSGWDVLQGISTVILCLSLMLFIDSIFEIKYQKYVLKQLKKDD